VPATAPTAETYHRLITLLDGGCARYRLIDHASAGSTDVVSRLRGNPLAAAAKCIVVRVGLSKRERQYLLAVVPGDRRVDLELVRRLYRGRDAAFAQREVAERLAGCVSGSILPFSFHPDLQVVVDRRLLVHDQLYFNAARLDRSMELCTEDYLVLARPLIAHITEPGEDHVPFTHQHPVPHRLQR
jgi:Ala-tRNA(Pro) deacylase